MSSARKRIVFDTSALVPVCLYPSREPAQIFRQAVLAHEVYTSPEAFGELMAVLSRDKFNAWVPLEARLTWVKLFHASVEVIEAARQVDGCRDPKDNKFLDLLLAAQADVLVSSDIHLLEMNPFRGVPIVQLTDFKRLHL
jgi:putative PIN family toxin of toxin-antitoxin system